MPSTCCFIERKPRWRDDLSKDPKPSSSSFRGCCMRRFLAPSLSLHVQAHYRDAVSHVSPAPGDGLTGGIQLSFSRSGSSLLPAFSLPPASRASRGLSARRSTTRGSRAVSADAPPRAGRRTGRGLAQPPTEGGGSFPGPEGRPARAPHVRGQGAMD